ncbi:MAG: iron-containing alcohol dehydrogenase [Pseudomonadota bacterium]
MNLSNLLTPQDWFFPVPIAFGPGRLAEIAAQCQARDIAAPLIVTDRGSRDLPFIGALVGYLDAAGLRSNLFSDISPNPRDDEIGNGCAAFTAGNHDAVIAIGGGSAMDGGKAIALTATSGAPLWDFNYTLPPPVPAAPFPKLITIPTTSGTGAETESTAMVTHVEKGMKFCLAHPDLKPSLALLDAELTLGLPPNLTAWTGVDALTHAIEAYLVPGFNPLCDAMALEAMHLIGPALPRVYAAPDDLEARSAMLMGSCLAGIAFLQGLGMVHAISHMVGAEFNTQHGLTNAICLPEVMRFNLPGEDQKVSRMAHALGWPEDRFIETIEALLDDLAIPKTLGDIGVPLDCAARIAEKALQDAAAGTNPKPATAETLQAMIERIITKGR